MVSIFGSFYSKKMDFSDKGYRALIKINKKISIKEEDFSY